MRYIRRTILLFFIISAFIITWDNIHNKEKYSVVILSFESGTKIQSIKAVRTVTGFGLVEAKTLVEEMPSTILKDLTKWKAERIKRKLENSGLEVEIRKH
jgi:ribosomal protein L7/L12